MPSTVLTHPASQMKLFEGNETGSPGPQGHRSSPIMPHTPLTIDINANGHHHATGPEHNVSPQPKPSDLHHQNNLKNLTSNPLIKMTSLLVTTDGDGSGLHLEYTEATHYSSVLAGINNLRRQGQYCDIKLVVEDHEFPVHRAVLAVCSPYMFDFFSCLEETTEQQPTYKVKDVPSVGFQYLLDFMYTGSLRVPLNEVPLVYATALLLKMESASRACANFLADHLTAANCLGIRQFSRDCVFQGTVDRFIRSNLVDIMNSKSFYGLTDLQVEVVGLDESISDEKMERRLFSLVLDWAKKNLNDLKPKLERLTEKVNVLYLDSDNTLRDCADVEDTVLSSDDDMVQDYKLMARRRSKSHQAKGGSPRATNGTNGQGFHKFNLNPEEAVSMAEREWSIVATRMTSENAYLAIAILDGTLMAISVHVRPPQGHSDATTNGASTDQKSPPLPGQTTAGGSSGQLSPIVRKASISPLEAMKSARCAMGAVELNGQIVVCGGYDRGECHASVEAFSLKDNQWTDMTPMNIARGRFSAAVLEGCIYVCGGSDGSKELSCVEKYDPATNKWTFMSSMIKERSSHGVVTLDGKLYCVGGCEGQRSISHCEVYDPSTNKWSRIASLNTARSQMCVCAKNGLLFAIGGTDLWNTLNTVEVYSPSTNEWTLHSQLNIARRGASVDIVNDIMVVLGGSDGTQSLVSTELYDPIADLWAVGPPLLTPRANLSAVTFGERLFAIGGFSGKKFLPTIEWLDMESLEWFGHAPKSPTESSVFNLSNDQVANGGKVSAGNDERVSENGSSNSSETQGENGKQAAKGYHEKCCAKKDSSVKKDKKKEKKSGGEKVSDKGSNGSIGKGCENGETAKSAKS